MTTPTGAAELPKALRPIQRYKIGYSTDEWGMSSSTPGAIRDASGAWVRYADHVAQVEALIAAQAGVPAVPRMSADEVRELPTAARDYIHQLAANADPAGMVRENMQLQDTNQGLQSMYRKAADALQYVVGCFHAAECEGLSVVLAETQDERLKDLVERRLMYALNAAQEFAAAPQPSPSPAPAQPGQEGMTEALGNVYDSLIEDLEDRVERTNYPGNELYILALREAIAAIRAARAAPQPATADALALLVEVAACFTRDDDLPNDLLPRIDAALAAQREVKP